MLAIKSPIGGIVRRARSKGLSVAEIAELAGRNPSTVWRWGTNKTATFVFDEGVERLVVRVEGLEKEATAKEV